MIAEYYLVILIRIHLFQSNGHHDPATHQKIQDIVTDLTSMYPGVFYTQKSVEELLLIMMGDDPEQLIEDGRFLAELIETDIEAAVGCQVNFGLGSMQQRLATIHLSFVDALNVVSQAEQGPMGSAKEVQSDLGQAPKLDQAAVERYLRSGLIGEFDPFFDAVLRQISEAALQSTLIKHYLFVDIILTAAQFVAEIGGEESEVVPAINNVESLLIPLDSIEQIREALRTIFAGVLAFRSGHAQSEKVELILEARAYIDSHFSDPNLLLEEVATSVNLSPSHFSMVFGRETGESFKSYLTRVRIEHAMELLRSTSLKCSEIAYQSGYNDPHYFSYAFKKYAGVPPQQFRQSIGE
jgi:two-component system response regulator YesN